MKKKILLGIGICIMLGLISIYQIHQHKNDDLKIEQLEATVLFIEDDTVMVRDNHHQIYKFQSDWDSVSPGDYLLIQYTGILNPKHLNQKVEVLSHQEIPVSNDESVPLNFQDVGIFKDFYILANNKLKELTLDEKIGQLLLVRYPEKNQMAAMEQFHVGGFIFFEKDFQGKTKQEVKSMLQNLQENSKIPLLTAVDEEGGEVVRVSSNPLLSKEKFLSSKELYEKGGLERIKEDTIQKSLLLKELGLNLNLAPVVDVSTTESDYIYKRALGKDTEITSQYAKTVIESSKGLGVSYTLKHFPGYGNNQDTHLNIVKDERSYETIKRNDLPPFQAGIEAQAEAVLINHNIITEVDSNHPASLSVKIHNILRKDLNFTGIVMTDDLSMEAVSSISDAPIKALLSGNDLLIVTDYQTAFDSIKASVEEDTISEELINQLAFRILAWKYYKGMMFDPKK